MVTKPTRPLIFWGIAAILVLDACKKYDDGPLISLRSRTERVRNTWKIDDRQLNNVVTELPDSINTGTYEFGKDQLLRITSDTLSAEGTWNFNHNKSKVILSYGDDLEARNVPWTILRLKETEFWVVYYVGDLKVEEHLVPN